MPRCGSQVVLCDLPIRFDTYRGCAHGCDYCFIYRKQARGQVLPGEGPKALRDWINGRRTQETAWCDWPIPLHWGGMSDPFQPAERTHRQSLACLCILADSGYPVVISTKGTLLATKPYRDVLARCNGVVQVSAVSSQLDAQDRHAPSFARRLAAIRRLVPCARRVIVRIQPYLPRLCTDVLCSLLDFAQAGVHGITIEGLKSFRARPGTVKVGTDHVFPARVLERDFRRIKARCRNLGLAFYAAENRLRQLGDDTCCCGTAGLGWRPNRANLNRLVKGKRISYTRRMSAPGTAFVFKGLAQDSVSTIALRRMSYREAMEIAKRVPAMRQIMGLSS